MVLLVLMLLLLVVLLLLLFPLLLLLLLLPLCSTVRLLTPVRFQLLSSLPKPLLVHQLAPV